MLIKTLQFLFLSTAAKHTFLVLMIVVTAMSQFGIVEHLCFENDDALIEWSESSEKESEQEENEQKELKEFEKMTERLAGKAVWRHTTAPVVTNRFGNFFLTSAYYREITTPPPERKQIS